MEVSDKLMLFSPVALSRIVFVKPIHGMARKQPDRFEALEKAGFKVDTFGGIQHAINIRHGVYYIDEETSCCQDCGGLDTFTKAKPDAAIVRYTSDGLAFLDGTEIKADVIVFATGFIGNLREHVEKILGYDIAERAEGSFGLNENGEILGAFKLLEQPNMWYLGGTLGHARYHSRFIALSIKADVEGTPIPVYND